MNPGPASAGSLASRHEQLPARRLQSYVRSSEPMARPPDGRYLRTTMTAKEKLRERIETFTEEEAAETLRLLDRRTDPLTVLLDNAPLDDEPVTEEEEAAVQIARDEIARGVTISLDELRAELDAER